MWLVLEQVSCLGGSAGGSSAGRSSGTNSFGCREMAALNGCLRLDFTTPGSKQDKQIHLPLGSIILNRASCIEFISQERWADAGSAAGGTAVQPGEGWGPVGREAARQQGPFPISAQEKCLGSTRDALQTDGWSQMHCRMPGNLQGLNPSQAGEPVGTARVSCECSSWSWAQAVAGASQDVAWEEEVPVGESVGVSGSALGVTAPLCPQEQAQGLWDQGCHPLESCTPWSWRDPSREFCNSVIEKRGCGHCLLKNVLGLTAVWSWGCGAAAASHLLGHWIQHAAFSWTVPRFDLGLRIPKNYVDPGEVAWAVPWSQP